MVPAVFKGTVCFTEYSLTEYTYKLCLKRKLPLFLNYGLYGQVFIRFELSTRASNLRDFSYLLRSIPDLYIPWVL
jgi:hypothetical protein